MRLGGATVRRVGAGAGAGARARGALDAWSLPAVLLAFSLLVAAGAAHRQSAYNAERSDAALDAAGRQLLNRIGERLQRYEYGLRGTRGAVLSAGIEGLDRGGFAAYSASRDSDREFPGADGFGFIRRVPAEREVAFIAAARQDGAPGFALRQFAPHAGERYIIQYIEPLQANAAALGLDIASDPARRVAAEAALRSGQVTLTRPIKLVQASRTDQLAFLALLPVYRPGQPLHTEAQRQAACVGWSYAPLSIGKVLSGIEQPGLLLTLDDETDEPERIFASGATTADAAGPAAWTGTQIVFGRQWRVALQPQPEFFAALNLLTPSRVFSTGVLVSVLAATLLFFVIRGRRRDLQIRGEQERLAALVAHSSDAMVTESVEGVIIDWNRAAERLLGYRAEEALGQVGAALLLPPERRAVAPSVRERLLRHEAVEPFDQVLLRHDGQHIEMSIAVSPIYGERGQLVAIGRTLRDISARNAAERERLAFTTALETQVAERTAELADTAALLQRVGAVAGVGGWEYDLATQSLGWTQQTRRMVGVDDSYAPQLDVALALYPETSRPVITQALEQAAAGGPGFDIEVPFNTVDGRALWVRVVGQGLPDPGDPGGKPVRLVGAFQDITRRHADDEALRAATQAAESANAAKSAFLANMSHEIRTPLNAMIGLTYLLDHSPLDTEQRSFVGKIQLASRSLLGVINDVLDLAKIEAGETRLDLAAFDLHELLDSLAGLYGDQAQSRGLAFALSQPEALPRRVLGDASRLHQVLSNLLSNAIKFTERGSVRLAVCLLDGNENEVTLRFEVSDTGIGIAAEVQDSVFQPFAQADASTTRRFGGTGLGLSIVRDLVALMGGQVELHSAPGEGSEFRITVTLGRQDSADAQDTRVSRLALRVLVIDDDPSQSAVLVAQAQALGWRVDSVGSAQSAIDLLRRAAEQDCLPEAIIVDWQLPSRDGLQTLAAVAAAIGRERLPPAVLVSAAAEVAGVKEGDDGLVDSRLHLPVDPSSLFNAVNRAVARRTGDPERALRASRLDGAGAIWLPEVRVLVVDDSDINREVAARILGGEGAVVTTCESGDDALERLRESPEAFDLLLMDVQMPGMDGNEATRQIRASLGLAKLPVLALTAGALLAERQRAIDAGMNDFISKPLDPDGLIRTVRRHVERARGVPLPVRLRAAPPQAAGHDPWPQIDGIDGTDAALRLGHDLTLFRKLLARLFGEFVDLMTEPVVPPRDAAERTTLAARAHKLRGSAGMLGARDVQRQAAEIEARSRRAAQGGTGSDVDATADPLQTLLGGLATALRALQQASAPALAQAPTEADPQAAEPLTDAARARLVEQLRQQDLSAQQHFARLSRDLRAALGNERFEAAREAVDSLRFQQALNLIEEPETA